MTDRDRYRGAIRDSMVGLTVQPAAVTLVQLHRRLKVVTTAAVTLIRGADLADVMLLHDGGFKSLAATDPTVGYLDAVQMRYRRGPCLHAAEADAIIRVRDLSLESRWPEFTAAALAAGMRSALTVQLNPLEHGFGALNVFSRAAGAFNLDDEAIGALLATHAAILVIASTTRATYGRGPGPPAATKDAPRSGVTSREKPLNPR